MLMATEKRLIEYYVVRNKNTGFYFRGKGANRWGEYHNQASIYRIKAHAENTLGWLLLRGEPVEIVPIQIVENPTDIAEVVRCKDCEKAHPELCHYKYEGCIWCVRYDRYLNPDDFCSYGERKTDV